MYPPHRHTKIVATIGPATLHADRLEAMLRAGVDVFRLNFSHGTPEDHRTAVRLVRELADRLGKPVAIMGDLQGPKIRTGPLTAPAVSLKEGAALIITTRTVPGDAATVSTTAPELPSYVSPGQRLLLDDGRLALTIEAVDAEAVSCRVTRGGELRANVGLNLPDVKTAIPSLTPKDEADLDRCVEWGLDLIALSFVQSPEDVAPVRERLRARGRRMPVIAKIEKRAAIDALPGVVRAFDGVLVARGDMAVETSAAEVPVFQKRIIEAARSAGKPVIVATQMMESMTHQPFPTRAEASDVANAVWDGADAVMLSGETAIGDYPVEVVRTVADIVTQAGEAHVATSALARAPTSPPEAIVREASDLARNIRAAALVVLTRSGRTARLASRERPAVPTIAITDRPAVYRQLALWWGIRPYLMPFVRDTDAMLLQVEAYLLAEGVVVPGQTLIITGAAPVASRGGTNFIKVQKVQRRVQPP